MFRESSRSGSGQTRLVPSSRDVLSSRLAHSRYGRADVGSNEPSDRRPSQSMEWSSSSSSSSSKLHVLQVITYLRKRMGVAVIPGLVLLYHLLRCANLTSCDALDKIACEWGYQIRNPPWVQRFHFFMHVRVLRWSATLPEKTKQYGAAGTGL